MQVGEISPKNSESVGKGGNRNLFFPLIPSEEKHIYGIHFVLDLCKCRKSMAIYYWSSDPVVEGFLEEGTLELR